MAATEIQYAGSELAAFAKARNWKGYLRRQIAPFLHGAVAEVGAGIGSMTAVLAECSWDSWLALEPDSSLAAQIAAAPRTTVFVGVLGDLPRNQLFDTIIYVDVLEHVQHDAAELTRAASHLTRGGTLVVLVPAHNFLFTPFDKAIGHFRRYNKSMLRAAGPPTLALKKLRYLDCVGFFASLANKIILHQSAPTGSQIRLWDRLMVPLSRCLDPLLGYSFGKSVLGVWEKA